jgi:dipeptidyl aminopeptidase/acylaminoacyl peptidase
MRRTALVLTTLVLAGATRAAAQQPPVIDRELFFGDPEVSGAQISPTGQFISFRKQYRGVLNLWLKGVNEPFDAARPLTADTTRPVRGYFWSEDGRYLLYVQDKGGNENYHVYAVDPTVTPESATGVPPARDLTPYGAVQAQIYAVPRATPNTIIVGLNDRDPQLHDVYRLNLTTGARELVLENHENVAGWQTDNAGKVRLGIRTGSDGSWQILRVDDTTLTQIYECSNEETCGPVRFEKGNRRVYMLTNKGDDVDLTRLVLFDPESRQSEPVESDPEGRVDFGGAVFSDVTDELLATVYVGDRVRIYPKTDAFAHDLQVLRTKLPEGELGFGSRSTDEKLWIVYVSRDVDPGSAYLFNAETGDVQLLYRSRPKLPSADLASMKAIRYRARDGLEIPAYLTLPKGLAAKKLPVVVMPHGGPWARDAWGYDPYAQFLANRGYAVLQPNFRGSTGYGKKFLNAGNKQWGTGAMQHDITDGVQYLIKQGIADPSRVAIFGGSYGGYATLAGVTFTPKLYAAGVSYVGPSNLLTLLKTIPPYWAPIKKIFDTRLGNPDDPADRQRLEEESPINSADQIVAPLLVIQGANDPRVNKAESEQIVISLRDRGHPVEYLCAPDEGHGFAGRENRLSVAVAMEKFLAAHVGGRYQAAVPPDIAAKLAAITVGVDTLRLSRPAASAASGTTLERADGAAVHPGTFGYQSTIKTMGQERTLSSTRTVMSADYENRPVWRVVDETQLGNVTAADTVDLDRATLVPVRRHGVGAGMVTVTFSDTGVTGEMRMGPQTVPIDAHLTTPVFAEGAGMDLVIAALPLAPDYATSVRMFSVLAQKVRPMRIAVTGTDSTTTTAGTFATYVVQVTPLDGDEGGTATYHVLTAAPHVVVQAETKLPAMMGSGTAVVELQSMGATQQ